MNINPNLFVRPDGPLSARIAIVGEAPGEWEVKNGRPFCGPAGYLLDKLLNRAGISRGDCYVTNVVKERPPQNDISKFIQFKTSKRGGYSQTVVTTTPEYDYYEQLLLDELKTIDANIIIAMGNVSMYALTRNTGITKHRGSMYWCKGSNKKVICTMHPAGIIRNHPNLQTATDQAQALESHFVVSDLNKALHESNFTELNYPEYDLIVEPMPPDIFAFFKECSMYKEVSFDIETTIPAKDMKCFSLAYRDEQKKIHSICVPLTCHFGDYLSPADETEVMIQLGRILESNSITVLTQNGIRFDSTFMFEKYGIRLWPIRDTYVAQAILYPEFPRDLGFLCSIYTNQPYYKDDAKEWRGQPVPDDRFWEYSARDSAVLFEIHDKQMIQLDKMGNVDAYMDKCRLSGPIWYMQSIGDEITNDRFQYAEEQKAEAAAIENEFISIVGRPINIRSNPDLASYFYGDLKIPPYQKKRKQGNRTIYTDTLDEKALRAIAKGTASRKPVYAAELVKRYRKILKNTSTYLEVHIDPDNRLRCSYNPIGAKSRLSSATTIFDTGTNKQNLPHTFYRFIKVDSGTIRYNIDLSQAEARIVAYVAPEPKLIHAFENGIDIHRLSASYIFGKPIEEISNEEGSSDLGNGEQSERYWGKKLVHGFNYGETAWRIAEENDLPLFEAKKVFEILESTYTGIRDYKNWIEDRLAHGRKLTDCFGKSQIFLGDWDQHLINAGCSYIPQSSIATIINNWGLLYIYFNQDKFRPVQLLNQVHDSIWMQMPCSHTAQHHAEILLNITKSLTQPLTWHDRQFSIPVECEVSVLNMGKKHKVKLNDQQTVTGLADELLEIYRGYRTSGDIQDLGWD